MRRWVICCAMALAANGWAETRTDEVRVPGTSWRSFNVPKEGDDLVLDVVPKQCWTITGSRITRQEDADDIVWKFDANASNPDLHRYRTYLKPAEAAPGSVFSSREWICVTGAARRTCGGGGGGGPAKFKVEVTATDVDVDGADNEATEEIAGVFICVDTNAVLPPRKAVYVRPVQPTPQVGNQTLKWPAAISMWELIWHNVNGKWHGQEIKLEGNSVSLPADEERTYWIQGETPAADVYLELEHTNEDNQKATDKVKVTVLKVELEFQNSKMSSGKVIDPYTPPADVRIGVVAGDTITFKAKLTPAVTLANSDYVWSGAQSGNGPTIAITFANACNYAEGLSVLGCPNLVARVTAMDVPLPNRAAWAILNPIAAAAAYNLATEALNWAAANWNALGGSSAAHNCRADAARHSYWNLIMSLDPDMDVAHAEGAATAHERTNLESTPNMHNEIVMDLQNNAVGRSLSSGFTSSTPRATLQAAIVSALNAGSLTILDDLTNANEVGLLKPSNQ